MAVQVQSLLSHLEELEELGGGAYRGALGRGVHRVGVEVYVEGEDTLLRVRPTGFLPAPLAAHPLVQQCLPFLGDMLASASLRPVDGRVELEFLVAEPFEAKAVFQSVVRDCSVVRSAASGIVAASDRYAAEHSRGEDDEGAAEAPRPSESYSSLLAAPEPQPDAQPAPEAAPADGGESGEYVTSGDDPVREPVTRRADLDALQAEFLGRLVHMRVVAGPDRGKTFALNGQDAYCIGRSPHVELHFDDSSISRRNTLLRWVNERLVLEDLDSFNGTRVNGGCKVASAILHLGDEIDVGETRLRVEPLGHADLGTRKIGVPRGVKPEADEAEEDWPTTGSDAGSDTGSDMASAPLTDVIGGEEEAPPNADPIDRSPPSGRARAEAPEAPARAARPSVPKPPGRKDAKRAKRKRRATDFFKIVVPEPDDEIAESTTDADPEPPAPSRSKVSPPKREKGRLQRRTAQFAAYFDDVTGKTPGEGTPAPGFEEL
ncbi:MAG: FHA domain-containing protein, partial [Planctomycetota bacterium]